jgi:hypothetical protein
VVEAPLFSPDHHNQIPKGDGVTVVSQGCYIGVNVVLLWYIGQWARDGDRAQRGEEKEYKADNRGQRQRREGRGQRAEGRGQR